jgi:hypothetical protein
MSTTISTRWRPIYLISTKYGQPNAAFTAQAPLQSHPIWQQEIGCPCGCPSALVRSADMMSSEASRVALITACTLRRRGFEGDAGSSALKSCQRRPLA